MNDIEIRHFIQLLNLLRANTKPVIDSLFTLEERGYREIPGNPGMYQPVPGLPTIPDVFNFAGTASISTIHSPQIAAHMPEDIPELRHDAVKRWYYSKNSESLIRDIQNLTTNIHALLEKLNTKVESNPTELTQITMSLYQLIDFAYYMNATLIDEPKCTELESGLIRIEKEVNDFYEICSAHANVDEINKFSNRYNHGVYAIGITSPLFDPLVSDYIDSLRSGVDADPRDHYEGRFTWRFDILDDIVQGRKHLTEEPSFIEQEWIINATYLLGINELGINRERDDIAPIHRLTR